MNFDMSWAFLRRITLTLELKVPFLLSNNSLPVSLRAFVSMWNEEDNDQTDWV
jgi:hypothetical protein